jgi:serine/threonine protein phosphatase PrpC
VGEQQSHAEWRVMGETVPGASHLRAGLPNQDAILQVRESGRGLPVVVSVSDGHGSDKCFRSDRGSRYAVKEATQLAVEFLDESRGILNQAGLESRASEYLPREFVRRWREAAEADLKARPFTKEELETVEKKDGPQALKLIARNPLLAYGATSLTVAVTESFALYLQLGDGEILNVSEAGEVVRILAEDERLFANETTSLCTPDAENNFRIRILPLAGEPPALILLSTDGYVNSFSDSAGFFKVGSDLLDMLRADGFDFVNASLKGWLEEATRTGSGDDCTLALACRMGALSNERGKQGAEGVKADEPAAGSTAEGVTTTPATDGGPAVQADGGPATSANPAEDASAQPQEAAASTQSNEQTQAAKPDGQDA